MELDRIAGKVDRGERLAREDALALYRTPDLYALAELADGANQRLHGLRVSFNVNRHLNPTNLCINHGACRFCSFSAGLDDPEGYTMTREEILAATADLEHAGATEVHVVGGLHPRKDYDWYLGIVRDLRTAHPRVHIKAWTAVEIDHFTRLTGRSAASVLAELREAGLGSLPGGGAEIFAEDVRAELCRTKAFGDRWLEIHAAAHGLGIPSNATMLYGHIETLEHRVDHMARLRDLQDRTRGFQAFIPLAYHPAHNPLPVETPTTGLDDLRTLAVARLFLDNFRHVKTYWIMVGEKLSQVALHFGANDIDGTVVRERITHEAGATTPEHLPQEELVRLIRRAGRVPVERNTLYEELRTWA